MGIARNLGIIGNTYLEIAKDNRITGKYNSYHDFPRNKTVALQQAKIYTDSAISILTEIGDLNTLSSNYKQLSEIQALPG